MFSIEFVSISNTNMHYQSVENLNFKPKKILNVFLNDQSQGLQIKVLSLKSQKSISFIFFTLNKLKKSEHLVYCLMYENLIFSDF